MAVGDSPTFVETSVAASDGLEPDQISGIETYDDVEAFWTGSDTVHGMACRK